ASAPTARFRQFPTEVPGAGRSLCTPRARPSARASRVDCRVGRCNGSGSRAVRLRGKVIVPEMLPLSQSHGARCSPAGAWQKPPHDFLIRIATAVDERALVLLYGHLGKGGNLFHGLSLIPRKRCPLADDPSAPLALLLHYFFHIC